MSIMIGGYDFSDPVPLSIWQEPFRAGIYAILASDVIRAGAGQYRLLYIGESSNFSERGFDRHHKRQCWFGRLGAGSYLYVAVHPMPGSDTLDRATREQDLIERLRPTCNDWPVPD